MAQIGIAQSGITSNKPTSGGGSNATQIQSVNVAATAPKDQQVLAYIAANNDWEPTNSEAYIPNRRWMSMITANGSTTTLGALGDVLTATGTLSAFGPQNSPRQANALLKISSATTGPIGLIGLNNYRGDHNFAALFIGDLFDGSIVTQRVWAGLTDQAFSTMMVSANPAGNYAAFRFDTSAGDTTIQCITKDGTTQNIINSGVAPVSGPAVRFAIVYNNVSSKVFFYMNGTLVATSSAHLPTATANMAQIFATNALSGSSSLTFETVVIEQDF